MKIWRKVTVGLLSSLAVSGLGLATWLAIPLSVDRSLPDAAVQYANEGLDKELQLKEGYFEFEGNSLHYIEGGAGEQTILFLHGFPSFWYSLTRQIEYFKTNYRVLAIDGLGAGLSDAPRNIEAYKLENMAAHLIALLDSKQIDRVHIVGHDWGAAFGFGLAQRYPRRVLTVTGISAVPQNVLLATLSRPGQQTEASKYVETLKAANPFLLSLFQASKRIWKGAYEPLVAGGYLSPDEGELFRAATSSAKRIDAHINWYRANIPNRDMIADDAYWPNEKSRVMAPALLIYGADDPTLTAKAIAGLEKVADILTIERLPKTGHWPHVMHVDKVSKLIAWHITG